MSEQITESSGNVFADIGLADAELLLAKAKLARQIGKAIKDRGLTATTAAKILQTDQPKVSKILGGHLKGFSTERLATFLTRLNHDVEITVRRRSAGRGRIRVRAVA